MEGVFFNTIKIVYFFMNNFLSNNGETFEANPRNKKTTKEIGETKERINVIKITFTSRYPKSFLIIFKYLYIIEQTIM